MTADRLSLLNLRRRSVAVALAALGCFSLGISYVVPVAATLASGGSTISALRTLETPTLEFLPLKVPAVTRDPGAAPPLVKIVAPTPPSPRPASTAQPSRAMQVPVLTNSYTTRALPKPPEKKDDGLPTYEDATGLETAIAVPDTKPLPMPEPKVQPPPSLPITTAAESPPPPPPVTVATTTITPQPAPAPAPALVQIQPATPAAPAEAQPQAAPAEPQQAVELPTTPTDPSPPPASVPASATETTAAPVDTTPAAPVEAVPTPPASDAETPTVAAPDDTQVAPAPAAEPQPSEATPAQPDPNADTASGLAPPTPTVVTPTEGGTATSSDGSATVVLAPASVSADTQVTVTTSDAPPPEGLQTLSPVYQLAAQDVTTGEQVTQFSAPPTLTVHYDEVPGVTAQIYYLDPVEGPQAIASTVDAESQTISAQLPHFSDYVVASTTTTTAQPDLHPTVFDVPATAVPFGHVTVTVQVDNEGGASVPSSSFWIDRIFLSNDDTLGAGDTPLGDLYNSGALAAGATYTQTATVTASAYFTGDYWLLVATDIANSVSESDETNNVIARPIHLGYPDLVGEIDAAPPTATAFTTIDVSWTVRNIGDAAVTIPTQAEFFISLDYVVDANDVSLGTVPVGPLAPGETANGTTTLPLPGPASPYGIGSYILLFEADSSNAVVEVDSRGDSGEYNNAWGQPLNLYPPFVPAPDLAVTQFLAPCCATSNAGEFAIDFEVTNLGVAIPDGSSWTDYLALSSDEYFSGDDTVLAQNPVAPAGGLGTGESYAGSFLHLIVTTPGNYFFLFLVNAYGDVSESDGTNNFASSPFVVIETSGFALSGVVFHDRDGSATRGDPAVEEGLGDFTVFLDADGNGLLDSGELSTISAADGGYSFADLSPGSYFPREVPRSGWLQTTPLAMVTLVDHDATADIGNERFAALEGFKIEDVDGDGVVDGSDHGLAGWTIYWDSNGNGVVDAGEPSAVTDATGHYALTVLERQAGSATHPTEEMQPGWTQTAAGPSSGCSITSHPVPCFYDFLNFRLPADLSVSSAGPASVVTGSSFAYSFAVHNAGPGAATEVSLSVLLDGDATFTSYTAPAGVVCHQFGADPRVDCGLLDLGPLSDETVELTFLAGAVGSFFMGGGVGAAQQDPIPDDNGIDVTVAIVQPLADLSVDLSGPGSAVVGELLSYSLVVTNNGPEPSLYFAAGAWDLGTNWVVTASGDGADCSFLASVPYVCQVAGLAVGASVTIALRATFFGLPGPAIFQARVYNDPSFAINPVPPDLNTSNDIASVTTDVRARQADLSVELSGPGSAVVGDLVPYSLVVTNTGPDESQSFTAGWRDLGSAGWAVTASVNHVACTSSVAVSYLCEVDGLAVGASVTIDLLALFTDAGSKVFTAGVYNDPSFAINPVPGDPNTANDLGSVTTDVRARQADLSVELSGPASGLQGELLAYSLTVSNNGPEASVHFVAGAWDIAAEWSDVSASLGGSACGVNGIAYLCEVNGLAVGGSVTIDLFGRFTGSGPATFNAKVYNRPDYAPNIQPVPEDPNTANDAGSVVTLILAVPPAPTFIGLAPGSDSGESHTDNLTRFAQPTFEVHGVPLLLTRLYAGDPQPLGSAYADAAGVALIIPENPLSDGEHDFTARQVSTDEIESADSAVLAVTIDSTTAAPTFVLDPSADGGTIGDGLTNEAVLVLDGVAEPGSAVSITYEYPHNVLEQRSTFVGYQQVIVGYQQVQVGVQQVQVGWTYVLVGYHEYPCGFFNQDTCRDPIYEQRPVYEYRPIYEQRPVYETQPVYTYYYVTVVQQNQFDHVVADASGHWTDTTPALSEGVHTFAATAQDVAGNTADASLTVTIDLTPPTTPTIGLDAATDSGVLGDGLTNHQYLNLIGTADPGQAITVWYDAVHQVLRTFTHLVGYQQVLVGYQQQIVGYQQVIVGSYQAYVGTDYYQCGLATCSRDIYETRYIYESRPIYQNVPVYETVPVYEQYQAPVWEPYREFDQVQADPFGYWHDPTVQLGEGAHEFTAWTMDAAGNQAQASFTATIDLTPPTQPTIALDPSTDSGVGGDAITNFQTLKLGGQADAGSTVWVTYGGRPDGAVVDPSGIWSLETSALPEGPIDFSVNSYDLAGNGSSAATYTVTIDVTPPRSPAFSLAPGSDSGIIGDGVTNLHVLGLLGVADPGAGITISYTAVHTVTRVLCCQLIGTQQVQVGTEEIPHYYQVFVGYRTYSCGFFNTETCTDYSHPIYETRVWYEYRPIYEYRPVYGDVPVTVQEAYQQYDFATADSSGSWYDVTVALNGGSHYITARTEDVAGNSAFASYTASIDDVPPATTLTSDPQSGPFDDNSTFTLTATDFGAGVLLTSYSVDGVTYAYNGPFQVTGRRGPVALSYWSIDRASNVELAHNISLQFPNNPPVIDSFSVSTSTSAPLVGESVQVSFAAHDADGDTLMPTIDWGDGTLTMALSDSHAYSSPGSFTITVSATDGVGGSAEQSLVIAVSVPAPSAPDLLASDDSGGSSSDDLTARTSLRFGVVSVPGATVYLWRELGQGPFDLASAFDAQVADGAGNVVLTLAPVADGFVRVRAFAAVAGVLSAASPDLLVVVDTHPPATLLGVDLALPGGRTFDNGVRVDVSAASELSLVVFGVSFSGVAPVDRVLYSLDGGPEQQLTSLVFSFPSITPGLHTLHFHSVDLAGNVEPDRTNTLAVAPPAPSAPDLLVADDHGVFDFDNVTNVPRGRYAVAGVTNAIVTLYVDGVVASTGLADASGVAILQPLAPLGDGPHVLTAIQSVDGITGPQSGALTVIIDTVAPAGTFTIAGTVIGGQLATKDPNLALAFSFADNAGGTGLGQKAFAVNGGAYSTPVTYSSASTVALTGADGLYTVSTRVTDVAGNAVVMTKAVFLDTTRPVVTVTSPAAGSSYAPGQTVTFSYTASDGAGVGIASSTATLDGSPITNGSSIMIDTLVPGTHTIVITVTDRVGNVTTVTSTFAVHATSANALIAAVNDGIAGGQITKSYGSKLLTALKSAQSFIDRGQYAQAKGALQAFETAVTVGVQTGQITPTYGALLIAWSADLRAHLP